MKRGRKPLTEDQVRGLCVTCGVNLQMPGPRSKLGYSKYVPSCSSCTKKQYEIPKTKKAYRKNKKPHCESCGFVAVDKCQLDVHHIDGNHDNDDPSNLQTLCANCHRLHHFKAA